jgi:cytochrome c553
LTIRNLVLPAVTLFAVGVFAPANRAQTNPAPAATQEKLPLWAYPDHFSGGGTASPSEIGHLAGSKVSYPKSEISSLFVVPDWYPDLHPPMPDVVAHGRKPDVGACGHCHLPNGQGRPENSSVAGLPEAYIVQQMADFKNGLRTGSDPNMLSVTNMVKLSKSISDEDVKAAAAYFSSLKLKPWIRVIEVDEVPKTRPQGGMMVVMEGAGKEPIGNRIIEVSEDLEKTELRDPTSGFIAYVPKGSLSKGKELVTTGGTGTTMACSMCHGADLKGTGNIPSIAGRSPSQMARQLIDFQDGTRNGPMAPMMKGVVSKLSPEDIVNITAYLSSQTP